MWELGWPFAVVDVAQTFSVVVDFDFDFVRRTSLVIPVVLFPVVLFLVPPVVLSLVLVVALFLKRR